MPWFSKIHPIVANFKNIVQSRGPISFGRGKSPTIPQTRCPFGIWWSVGGWVCFWGIERTSCYPDLAHQCSIHIHICCFLSPRNQNKNNNHVGHPHGHWLSCHGFPWLQAHVFAYVVNMHLSTHLLILCIHFSFTPSIDLSICIYLPTYLSIYRSMYPSIHRSIHLSIYLPTYLSNYLSIDLSIYLSLYVSAWSLSQSKQYVADLVVKKAMPHSSLCHCAASFETYICLSVDK